MSDRVFLTDTRRSVLEGDYEGKDNYRRAHETRIRKKTRIALNELIEVAESPQIRNEDVFDPADVRTLLEAILGPVDTIDPFSEHFDDRADRRDYRQQYHHELQVLSQLNHLSNVYSSHLLNPDKTDYTGLLE